MQRTVCRTSVWREKILSERLVWRLHEVCLIHLSVFDFTQVRSRLEVFYFLFITERKCFIFLKIFFDISFRRNSFHKSSPLFITFHDFSLEPKGEGRGEEETFKLFGEFYSKKKLFLCQKNILSVERKLRFLFR
jgi:hypothetical protein